MQTADPNLFRLLAFRLIKFTLMLITHVPLRALDFIKSNVKPCAQKSNIEVMYYRAFSTLIYDTNLPSLADLTRFIDNLVLMPSFDAPFIRLSVAHTAPCCTYVPHTH